MQQLKTIENNLITSIFKVIIISNKTRYTVSGFIWNKIAFDIRINLCWLLVSYDLVCDCNICTSPSLGTSWSDKISC
jgi:hypothetical protein